uniref:cyclin family protein n=1 Tax=Klebsiella pneumoniae TaxID=573 RepID=UPI0025A156BA
PSHLPVVAGSSVEDLKPCMRRLLALQRAAHDATDYMSPYLAVRDKYSSHQWFCVARVQPYDRLPSSLLGVAASPESAPPTK